MFFRTLVSEIFYSKFFLKGFPFTFGTAIAENEHVAVHVESNGRKYANRQSLKMKNPGLSL